MLHNFVNELLTIIEKYIATIVLDIYYQRVVLNSQYNLMIWVIYIIVNDCHDCHKTLFKYYTYNKYKRFVIAECISLIIYKNKNNKNKIENWFLYI